MLIIEFFAHLKALGFYDDVRAGSREALRLDLPGKGAYLIVTDDALRIPDGTRPIFVGLYSKDGRQLESKVVTSFQSACSCISRMVVLSGQTRTAEEGA